MTVEEFQALNLPEESSLMLIKGIVYDDDPDGDGMTGRNQLHARTESKLCHLFHMWRDNSGGKYGIYSGEVGCILTETGGSVGIDVAVFSPETVAEQREDLPYISGVPLLAVEILSPNDRNLAIREKIDQYLSAGVRQVWIIDVYFKTIVVHRAEHVPEMFATDAVLVANDVLPGFSVKVFHVFE